MIVDGDDIRYVRPTYAGNVMATMQVTSETQFVTVRQSEFDSAEEDVTEFTLGPRSAVSGVIGESIHEFEFGADIELVLQPSLGRYLQ